MYNFQDRMFEQYDSFIAQLNYDRDEMLKRDYSILEKHHGIFELDCLEFIPNGRFTIRHRGVNFECLFHYKKGTFLYTFLNGAISTRGEFPKFGRWSYYSYIDGSMFNISDPMLELYEDLHLGWYYGTKDVNFRKLVAEIVDKIASVIGVTSENVVFYGSSGGGSATLECSSYLKGSKTVSINPQLYLGDWPYAKEFETITKQNLSEDKFSYRDDIAHFLKLKSNQHIIIINVRSEIDMQQLKKLAAAMDIQLKIGLNVFEGYTVWLYDADCSPYIHPHNIQEFYCVFWVIEHLLKQDYNKDRDEYKKFIRLINEFWYNRWAIEKQLKTTKELNRDVLIRCRENERVVALFGGGEFFNKLNKEVFDLENKNYYKVTMVIDNNIKKNGMLVGESVSMIHPSEINNWSGIFVIITSELYCKEIQAQLNDMGLQYKKDYITWTDLYIQ